MASTADCTAFLESHPDTQGKGPWKRTYKRKVGTDWERGFSSRTQALAVTVKETVDGQLSLGPYPSVDAPFSQPELSLFERYRPKTNLDDGYLSRGLSGRVVYGSFEVDQTYGKGVEFMCTFEMKDGEVFTDHRPEIDQLVEDVLRPTFADRLMVSVMEGTHCVLVKDLDDADDLEETDPAYRSTARQIKDLLKKAGAHPMREMSLAEAYDNQRIKDQGADNMAELMVRLLQRMASRSGRNGPQGF